ncbi:MAG: methyl-accepting chemotaxis protein [Nitrospira sp.]|jgi:nitrogen fixation/metabolism regulation signal transduction histidine kinase|nr:methyl-accepting chemotaxis protein [Nitrospira sp.]MDH4355250.1 methyl-accepting chemotaxis protein [Nitrospira sp.]MDH5319126.1 methyl-accepting chemotaxis protein [Nitrospira sp.]
MGEPLRLADQPSPQPEGADQSNRAEEAARTTPKLTVVPSPEKDPQARESPHYKRRLFSVVHPLQIRMLLQVIAYSLIVFVLLAIPVFQPLMQALDNPALSWEERAVVANDLLNLHARFWPWALGASMVVLIHCIHSLRLMHRVAGPLYRLRKVFPKIAEGNLSVRTTLRQHDYLAPEVDLVNHMTAQLQSKINQIKQAQVILALDAARMKELAVAKNDPALVALAKQMEQNLAAVKTSLDGFKTHNG